MLLQYYWNDKHLNCTSAVNNRCSAYSPSRLSDHKPLDRRTTISDTSWLHITAQIYARQILKFILCNWTTNATMDPAVCKKSKVSHTRLRAFGTELIPVSWQSACRWLSHKPGGRLLLLSTRPTVTFPAKEITPLGRYQIILLGDRGTQV